MVFRYGVVAEYGAGAPRRRPSVASSPSRNRARSVPSKASTEPSASSHSLVSTGSTSFSMAIRPSTQAGAPAPPATFRPVLGPRSFHQPRPRTSLDLPTLHPGERGKPASVCLVSLPGVAGSRRVPCDDRGWPLLLLLLGACTGPVRSTSVYESKAGATAETVASAVETARLAAQAARDGDASGR